MCVSYGPVAVEKKSSVANLIKRLKKIKAQVQSLFVSQLVWRQTSSTAVRTSNKTWSDSFWRFYLINPHAHMNTRTHARTTHPHTHTPTHPPTHARTHYKMSLLPQRKKKVYVTNFWVIPRFLSQFWRRDMRHTTDTHLHRLTRQCSHVLPHSRHQWQDGKHSWPSSTGLSVLWTLRRRLGGVKMSKSFFHSCPSALFWTYTASHRCTTCVIAAHFHGWSLVIAIYLALTEATAHRSGIAGRRASSVIQLRYFSNWLR